MLDAVIGAHPGKVRLVYKSYTLPSTARRARGARRVRRRRRRESSGRWSICSSSGSSTSKTRTSSATRGMLKLDIAKWKADMDSPAVKDRVSNDHKLSEDLNLKGTPTST